ncbi:MAG: hypothetical protein EOP53_23525, partial [Sphingobacteriales bacterium]
MEKKTIRAMAVVALFTGILATGCLKESKDNTPIPVPQGKFSGKFIVIKKKAIGTGFDTTKTPLKLTMKADSGYTVHGDSLGNHATSNGTYAYNYYYIQFSDKTLPDTSSKRHLNGTYQYFYDGSVLQIGAVYADT